MNSECRGRIADGLKKIWLGVAVSAVLTTGSVADAVADGGIMYRGYAIPVSVFADDHDELGFLGVGLATAFTPGQTHIGVPWVLLYQQRHPNCYDSGWCYGLKPERTVGLIAMPAVNYMQRRLLAEVWFGAMYSEQTLADLIDKYADSLEASVDVLGVGVIHPAVSQATPDVIVGYRIAQGQLGINIADNRFFKVGLEMVLGAHYPFTYVGQKDERLDKAVISKGLLTTRLGSESARIQLDNVWDFSFGTTKDWKWTPSLSVWIPFSDEVTLMFRGNLGMLFPSGYGQALENGIQEGDTRDQQFLYIRGFLSGGQTNRGFPSEWLGARGPASFLAPLMSLTDFRDKCQWDSGAAECNMAMGGLSMWGGTAELGFPIAGPVSGVVFADTSDVSREKTNFRFQYLHLSPGIGFRLNTDLATVRLDIAYRVPGLQVVGGASELWERDPGNLLGLPITFNLGIEKPVAKKDQRYGEEP